MVRTAQCGQYADRSVKGSVTKEQFRAVWTTYCIMLNLNPDTATYDNALLKVYTDYRGFESQNHDEYDLFMSALLC